MSTIIEIKKAESIAEYIRCIEEFNIGCDNTIYFRGEPNDYKETAFSPSVYRKNYLGKEHLIYREMQRFNDYEFNDDRTTFDKLSRMQHFLTPTRLIDLSEDALTALYFAVSERKNNCNAVVYVVSIKTESIKYYDSDTVSVISNLCKQPLKNKDPEEKSKESIHKITKVAIEKGWRKERFNSEISIQYLLHDIRDDVTHFKDLINPRHIFSIQCVKPKLANTRIYGQKGAFLLFGLNSYNVNASIPVLEYDQGNLVLHESIFHSSPIVTIMKIEISCKIGLDTLKKVGITAPYIYPGLEKVSEYFKEKFGGDVA